MSTYANAKRILRNSEARISQSPEGIFDQNAVVIFWDIVEARYINECVNYLNDLNEQPVLSGPTQFYDTIFEEDLYHLHAYYDEDADRPDPNTRQQRIYRIMMRNPVAYSADNWGETSTRWKLETGDTATNGPSSLLTLSMANVTVEAALSFELQEFISPSFTDEIYLLRGILLQGEWFSIRRKSEVNPKTGLYKLYWFLAKNNAVELFFTVQTSPTILSGYYYLWDASEETLKELMENTYFDSYGHSSREYTVTANRTEIPSALGLKYKSGSAYYRCIKVNSTTKAFSLPGFWTLDTLTDTLQEEVSGRTVLMRRTSRDPEDRLFDVEVEIKWTDSYQLSDAASAITFQKFDGSSITIDQGFGIPDSLLPNIAANYNAAALNENQLANFQFERDQENGTFRYTASITTLTAKQGYVDAGDRWILFGGQVNSASAIDVPSAIDSSGIRTWTQLKAALATFKTEGSVSASTETGLFSYNIQVMKNGSASSEVAGQSASPVEQRWIENGRGPVLPVDIVSTYDTVNGLWYEIVDFDFDGVSGSYSWKKKTTRHQIADAGYTTFMVGSDWKKEEVVVNRTFQPVRVRNRGNWKEEAVPWLSDWNAQAQYTPDAPPASWISSGFQALYGDWQPWFCKASIVPPQTLVPTEDYPDDWLVSTGYVPNDLVTHASQSWRCTSYFPNKGFSPTGAATSNAYWTYVSTAQHNEYEDPIPVPAGYGDAWNVGLTYAGGAVCHIKTVEPKFGYDIIRFFKYTAINVPVTGQAPAFGSPYWTSLGMNSLGTSNVNASGDNFGDFIGRSGTGYSRYTPDRFGQKSLNWNQKILDKGVLGIGGGVNVTPITRDLTYSYICPAHGFAVYDHEVVLLKKYKARREFVAWNEAFDSYQAGEANEGETPPEWESLGYLERYGAWSSNYVKSEWVSGDDCGALVGLKDFGPQRYQPTPHNIGMNWSTADRQAGILGLSGGVDVVPINRDITYLHTTMAYGFSVYSHALMDAVVLTASGEPEMDAETGVNLTANAYEHRALSVTGYRKRRRIASKVERKYLVVNPALITNNPVPEDISGITDDTNTNVAYKLVRIQEFLWAVEKMTTEFLPWEADGHRYATWNAEDTYDADTVLLYSATGLYYKAKSAVAANVVPTNDTYWEVTEEVPEIIEANYPEVDASGYYHYWHFPAASSSVFGTDTTAGKVTYLKTVYD